MEPAREEIEALEDDVAVPRRRLRLEVGPPERRDDAAECVDREDARARSLRADRLAPEDAGAREPELELEAPPVLVRREERRVARGPREVGGLVHRREPPRSLGLGRDVARGRAAVLREALGERVGEEVDVVRVAEVEEIPHHVEVVAARRREEGREAREVEAPAAVDERPAHGFAHGADPHLAEPAVVVVREPVVLGRRDLVDPPAVHVVAGRALEPGEEEAPEHG